MKNGKNYKYFYQYTTDYNEAKKFLVEAKKSGFNDAVIVAFNNENRISIDDFLNMNSYWRIWLNYS